MRRLLSSGNTPPSTTFDNLFRCAPFGTLHPRRVAADASLFSLSWCRPCGRRTKHPSGSRRLDVSPPGQTSAPGIFYAPENRQFPAASKHVLHNCHGSLAGPVSLWRTAEASPNSPIQFILVRMEDGMFPVDCRTIVPESLATRATPIPHMKRHNLAGDCIHRAPEPWLVRFLLYNAPHLIRFGFPAGQEH